MENGKCAIARGLRNGVGFGSTEFHIIRGSPHLLPEWFYYYWRLPKTRALAGRNMTGTAGQKRVPTSFLEALVIPIPSVEQQRNFTRLLQEADKLCRARRYALQMCDEFLPAVFLKMFAQPPASWPTLTIEQLAESRPNAIRTGPFGSQLLHSEFTTSGVAVLGIDNAVNNRFDWVQRRYISSEKYEQLKRYTVFPEDVIITIMGTCGDAAKMLRVNGERDGLWNYCAPAAST
jgi:type I restriction enzyme S subunit